MNTTASHEHCPDDYLQEAIDLSIAVCNSDGARTPSDYLYDSYKDLKHRISSLAAKSSFQKWYRSSGTARVMTCRSNGCKFLVSGNERKSGQVKLTESRLHHNHSLAFASTAGTRQSGRNTTVASGMAIVLYNAIAELFARVESATMELVGN